MTEILHGQDPADQCNSPFLSRFQKSLEVVSWKFFEKILRSTQIKIDNQRKKIDFRCKT